MALTSSDILQSALTSYVLRGLTLLSVYLAQKGLRADDVLTPENIAILAGALVVFIIDAFTTLYRKAKDRNLVEAARESEPDTSMKVIQERADQKHVIGD